MGTGSATLEQVQDAAEQLLDVCRRLDPGQVPLDVVESMVDELAQVHKASGGALVRLAARYDEAGAWRRDGCKSAEDGLSRKTGTSTQQARRNIRTSKRLKKQPKTDQALKQGQLSPDQANEVSDAADASPGDESALLRSAGKDPLHELKRKAAEAKARADKDREETRRRQHAARCVRRWTDVDGMAKLLLSLPPDSMAEVDAALKPRIDRAFADARHAGRMEPVEAYAADVVHGLLTSQCTTGSGSAKGTTPGNQAVRPDKKVIALIDVEALNRGFVEGDETCEIAGVGPVSVSAVRRLMSDAFLTLVFERGVDVLNVTHLGRQVTATQRTALEARGARCEVCGGTHLLAIDHNEGWTLTHDTRVEDLSWLCWHDHDLKTRYDLRLEGTPGDKRLMHRDGRPWRGPPGGGGGPPDGRAPPEPTVQADLFTHAS